MAYGGHRNWQRPRGNRGRFRRLTLQDLGIPQNEVNSDNNRYLCLECGEIFVPILKAGQCGCGSEKLERVKS